MAEIRWLCVSDLHLGALNSVLSNVTADGQRIDRSAPGPVLTALADALRSLRGPDDPAPTLVVLGDLMELALTTPDDAAATFAHLVAALAPGTDRAAVGPGVLYVPGNHDHHLWARASDDRVVELLTSSSAGYPDGRDRHATRLLPAHDAVPVRDRFLEALAARARPAVPVTVTQSYPNLGLVSDDGRRAVVASHGHFLEPLYRLMSHLDTVFADRAAPVDAWELEAQNGGWVDFFWSSMGDSGDVMRVTRTLYESLQSREALHAEVAAVVRAIEGSRSGPVRAAEAHAVGALLDVVLDEAVRERHRPGAVLSPAAEVGLGAYLAGPVATQVHDELARPADLTFLFGHTHKPFAGLRSVDGLPDPVAVANTGGWVVDQPVPSPVKGAAVIAVDGDLQVACLRIFNEGPASSYRLRIHGPRGEDDTNPLVDRLAATIDPDAGAWAALADVARVTVAHRAAQLEERLHADADALDREDGRSA